MGAEFSQRLIVVDCSNNKQWSNVSEFINGYLHFFWKLLFEMHRKCRRGAKWILWRLRFIIRPSGTVVHYNRRPRWRSASSWWSLSDERCWTLPTNGWPMFDYRPLVVRTIQRYHPVILPSQHLLEQSVASGLWNFHFAVHEVQIRSTRRLFGHCCRSATSCCCWVQD